MLSIGIAVRKFKHPVLGWMVICVAAYMFFLSSRAWTAGFRFEEFEGFLGVGRFHEAEATKAFLDVFPLGTPVQKIEQYFESIGGHCNSLRGYPAEMFCGYEHLRYPPVPFLASTWGAEINYDVSTNASTGIKITGGIEGP
jgi:hypothetical protein